MNAPNETVCHFASTIATCISFFLRSTTPLKILLLFSLSLFPCLSALNLFFSAVVGGKGMCVLLSCCLFSRQISAHTNKHNEDEVQNSGQRTDQMRTMKERRRKAFVSKIKHAEWRTRGRVNFSPSLDCGSAHGRLSRPD